MSTSLPPSSQRPPVDGGGNGKYIAIAVVLLLGIGALFVWLVLLFVAERTTIRVKEINKDGIFLTGVAAEFADRLPEQPRISGLVAVHIPGRGLGDQLLVPQGAARGDFQRFIGTVRAFVQCSST